MIYKIIFNNTLNTFCITMTSGDKDFIEIYIYIFNNALNVLILKVIEPSEISLRKKQISLPDRDRSKTSWASAEYLQH